MPSFDVALEPDMVKINNGVSTAIKEVGTRFDFKGTSASLELKEKEKEIHLIGDSDFQIDQIYEVLVSKLTKQGVTINFFTKGASYSSISTLTLPGSLLQRTPSKMKNSGSGPKNAVSPRPDALR